MDRIGIECLSVFGMPPVQLIDLTADLGCRYMTVNLSPARHNPHFYPEWSLRDRALRNEMTAAMRDRDVSISLGEGFAVKPGKDVSELASDLDLMRELGVTRINAVSVERGWNRSLDQLAKLAEMANTVGIETTTEIGVGVLRDLTAAVAALRHVARPDFRLLIDTMHFFRLGSSIADIDPDLIGYVQLCDVPLASKMSSYMEEATCERMAPGAGELPLYDLLAVVPRHLIVGLEVPMRARAEAGVAPFERLKPCVEATRDLLARLDGVPTMRR